MEESKTTATNAGLLTSGDRYEDARSLNQQLTFDKTHAYFEKKGLELGSTQMRTLNMIGEDDAFTNLAMLLSEQCPHSVKLAVFQGSKKTVFRDRRELTGSLLEQLDEAFSYIALSNHTHAEFAGLERIDHQDYPPEALREALLNAIVHRDYSISGPTLISLFDDRIEFVSLGGLVRGISYGDIMLGISVLRNPHLANVFYRLELIEAYGTGMLKIQECYTDCDVKPKIEVSDNAFKITLPNRNFLRAVPAVRTPPASAVPVAKRHEAVMKLFDTQETITRKDIETALKVSQATAILTLRKMVAEGLIVKEGGGKHLRYRQKK